MVLVIVWASSLARLAWKGAKPLAESGTTGDFKEAEDGSGTMIAHVSRARPALAGEYKGSGPSD